MTTALTPRATPAGSARPGPPAPAEDLRWRLRATVGAGQLLLGVAQLRRRRTGWYHVALGARQLVQARMDAAGAFSPAADRAVDGLHTATMLAAALVARSDRRRRALTGAAHAAAWTALDAALSRRRRTRP